MKLFDLARLVALPLVVGACATNTTTTRVSYDKVGIPDIFQYAAMGRDFLTEIHGNPSDGSKAAFDASVIAATHGHARGRPSNFTTTPSANAREGYRMVLVFSGDLAMSGEAACRSVNADALPPITSQVEVQAAFCYRDDVLSQAHVAYPQGSSALESAVTQVVINLFPINDPNISHGSNNDNLFP